MASLPAPEVIELGRTISGYDVDTLAVVAGEDRADDGRVPGELLLGMMSAASAMWCQRAGLADSLSYGYDDLRFIASVHVGDTVTIRYEPVAWAAQGQRLVSRATATLPGGRVVASSRHILWMPRSSTVSRFA